MQWGMGNLRRTVTLANWCVLLSRSCLPGVRSSQPITGPLIHLECFVFVFFPRLNRASQTYFFPIHLTDQLLPSAVFYATVGPLVVYFAMHRLIIKPYLRAQKEK
jgi:hypothetical protein